MSAAILVGMDVRDLPTPVVVIDRAVLTHNARSMADHASGLGIALRPHWKTTKSAQAAALQLEFGAIGHTAATSAELKALAGGISPSVFLAYPPVGSARVSSVLESARTAEVIVGTDSVAGVHELGHAAVAAGVMISFRLDVDTGLGRTGVDPSRAVEVARELSKLPGLRFDGVWTHEGHVQGVGADPARRQQTGLAAGLLLVEVADAIRADGHAVDSVSVGSTPGAWSAPTVSGVTEARPGTYILGDENQVAIGTISEDDVAVSVLSRIVSTQRGAVAIIDAGIKALSSDGSLHGDGRVGTIVSSSGGIVATAHEEHGFLHGAADARVGDVIRIRPNHACGVMNMHSMVAIAEDGVVVDSWRILARH
ncbi:alanine racemase [Microbacterium saperdae]